MGAIPVQYVEVPRRLVDSGAGAGSEQVDVLFLGIPNGSTAVVATPPLCMSCCCSGTFPVTFPVPYLFFVPFSIPVRSLSPSLSPSLWSSPGVPPLHFPSLLLPVVVNHVFNAMGKLKRPSPSSGFIAQQL